MFYLKSFSDFSSWWVLLFKQDIFTFPKHLYKLGTTYNWTSHLYTFPTFVNALGKGQWLKGTVLIWNQFKCYFHFEYLTHFCGPVWYLFRLTERLSWASHAMLGIIIRQAVSHLLQKSTVFTYISHSETVTDYPSFAFDCCTSVIKLYKICMKLALFKDASYFNLVKVLI